MQKTEENILDVMYAGQKGEWKVGISRAVIRQRVMLLLCLLVLSLPLSAASGSGLLGTVPVTVDDEGDIVITMSFWETGESRERLENAISLFESQNPGIDVEAEFVDYSGYWGNLSADIANGKLSDIIEIDSSYLRQFSERGLLMPLSDSWPSVSGYAIPIGVHAPAMLYDRELASELGLSIVSPMSFSTFSAIGREVYERTGLKTESRLGLDFLEALAAFNGSDIYSEIQEGDISSSYEFFSIVKEIAGMDFIASPGDGTWNRFAFSSDLEQGEAAVSVSSGIRAYSMLAVSSSSQVKEAALYFISWLASSEEAGEVLRYSFGIPVFRSASLEDASPEEAYELSFVSSEAVRERPLPPIGNVEISRLLSSAGEAVQSGSADAASAAASFVSSAAAVLGKAGGEST